MAGPHEQSGDTGLDDILSSIRRIISDDLDGADDPHGKRHAAAAVRSDGSAAAAQPSPVHPAAVAPQIASLSNPGNNHASLAPNEHSAPPVTLVREAPGTLAGEFAASEQHPSQADLPLPRESLAPFDRQAEAPAPAGQLSEPIVLPTEADVIDQAAHELHEAREMHALSEPATQAFDTDPHETEVPGQQASVQQALGEVGDLAASIAAPRHRNGLNSILAVLNGTPSPAEPGQARGGGEPANGGAEASPENARDDVSPLDLGPPSEPHSAVAVEQSGSTGGAHTVSEAVAENPAPNGQIEQPAVASSAPPDAEAPGEQAAADVQAQSVAQSVPGQQPAAEAPTEPIAELAGKPPVEPSAVAKAAPLLEQTVTRLLRPMLQEWLDANMPRLIEQALREDFLPADVSGQNSPRNSPRNSPQNLPQNSPKA